MIFERKIERNFLAIAFFDSLVALLESHHSEILIPNSRWISLAVLISVCEVC
jgi:hypothetical protein